MELFIYTYVVHTAYICPACKEPLQIFVKKQLLLNK